MEHYIFSETLKIENLADTVHIEKPSLARIKELKNSSSTDIYLCGGGEFSGWLLENQLIDQLKLKLNPIVLGKGIPLFGSCSYKAKWKLIETELFDDGLQIMTYDVLK